MANTGRMTTGTLPRSLQLGVDKFIDHFSRQYKGEGERIFTKSSTEKGFYEIVQLAGMGLAALKGEGSAITNDSVDQEWNSRFAVFTYEKSCRFTMESKEDNLYQDLMPMYGKEMAKALAYNKDYQMANILNNCVSSSFNGPDGVPLASTAHPLQAGGTSSNRLSPDMSLSEDALEQAVILTYNMLNPDGLQSDYKNKYLVVPTALMFTAARIMGSKYRTNSADNDINAVNHRGDVQDYIVWKRLSSSTRWFLTTDADNSLILCQRKGVTTTSFNDDNTYDTIITAHERFRALFADWRGVIVSNA